MRIPPLFTGAGKGMIRIIKSGVQDHCDTLNVPLGKAKVGCESSGAWKLNCRLNRHNEVVAFSNRSLGKCVGIVIK